MSSIIVALQYTHVLLLVLSCAAGRSAAGLKIGGTIFLPETNLGSPLSPLRQTIFEGDISGFLANRSLLRTYNTQRFQRTSETVFQELGLTFGISVPIKVLQLSFDLTFRSISGSQQDVSSALILVESYSIWQFLQNEASLQQIPLRTDFLQELRNLPEPPTSIMETGQWTAYRDFLRRWGSHYISGVYYGSWLRTWSTAASSKQYTQREITAKGCAELTGSARIPSVQGCAGIEISEMNAASRLDINVQVEVRGGEANTRTQLTVKRTDELVEQFIREGQENDDAAVKYDLVPIWRPVLAKYHSSTSKEWRVAMALEGYYNGYLAFGCGYRALSTPAAVVLQLFRRTSAGMYQCVRQCQGCRRNADCNLQGTGCFCYGSTCIAALGEDGRATIQTSRDALPRDVLPNVDCYYSFPSCRCSILSREANCGSDNLVSIWEQTAFSITAIDNIDDPNNNVDAYTV